MKTPTYTYTLSIAPPLAVWRMAKVNTSSTEFYGTSDHWSTFSMSVCLPAFDAAGASVD